MKHKCFKQFPVTSCVRKGKIRTVLHKEYNLVITLLVHVYQNVYVVWSFQKYSSLTLQFCDWLTTYIKPGLFFRTPGRILNKKQKIFRFNTVCFFSDNRIPNYRFDMMSISGLQSMLVVFDKKMKRYFLCNE